eukprot:m.120486 g.120486  ORF g.120486 m.120486 type:complete len:283 (+) comp37733_c0_seq3:994-1842(+)
MLRDTMTVVFVNSGTSLFASITVFAIIGFKAEETGIDAGDVSSGPSLAFVALTEGLVRLPGGPFWSILLFVMLITLVIDSQFGSVEVIITEIYDYVGKKHKYLTMPMISGVFCFVSFVMGIGFVCQSGYYQFQLFDIFSVNIPLLVSGLFECIALAWIYGINRFAADIERLSGSYPSKFWIYTWRFVLPIVLLLLLVGGIVKQCINPPDYTVYRNFREIDAAFPAWALLVGILLTLSGSLPVFVAMIVYCVKNRSVDIRNPPVQQQTDEVASSISNAVFSYQ